MTITSETPTRVTNEDWEQRFSSSTGSYNLAGRGRCWRMWHPDLANGPICAEPLDHKGVHEGHGIHWSRTPRVSREIAEQFLACYKAIPSHYHDVTLSDDGAVTMTLRALRSALRLYG